MNITILGAGAVGSLWACHLASAGHAVTLWLRAAETTTHTIQMDDNPAVTFPANNDEYLEQSDLILITVKAWQVKDAILPLLSKLHPDTILMFMHNGMGAVEQISHELCPFPVVLATTTQAAIKPASDTVKHTGSGLTRLGPFNEKGNSCSFLAAVLHHALPEAIWTTDIYRALWQKLAINCAINPLTALEQCQNGRLAENRYAEQLDTIVQEVSKVMQKEGIAISTSELKNDVRTVITATAENYSSMQQDICHHRQSEIDYITGYLCAKAELHHISIPANQTLYAKIKRIEQGWRTS